MPDTQRRNFKKALPPSGKGAPSARAKTRKNTAKKPSFRGFTPEQLAARAAAIPVMTYPDLPVSAVRETIAQAIRDHQVVIVSGETGSGKTTQLPKICLQLGRGVKGMIGHTQPRRIAARAVAQRIAAELGQSLGKDEGNVVGYQVRFTDDVGPTTLVKLMTDGILLAEIHSDPLLRKYDTLIIDEAHERSLNIDFILGYLAQLLPKRPDLKVIITSATIDSARFAEHFGTWQGTPGRGTLIEAAPIIEVSGRTYPVELRYRPLAPEVRTVEESAPFNTEDPQTHDAPPSASPAQHLVLEDPDGDLATMGYGMGEALDIEAAICHAVDELCGEGDGDILVFLPGERDIRDTQQALIDHLGPKAVRAGHTKGARPGDIEIMPLYARLSAAEQQRIFQPHTLRRIVLATNVAETSLTVPGIRYVIDPGLARISRYSKRTKVQRLPIEGICQASANQRAGRCGRVADGVAIRLYSQRDFASRPRFVEPEILRTSLASVILQMVSLGLGNILDFPFIDPPDRRAIRDGLATLTEIGAIVADTTGHGEHCLTPIGRTLAQLPIDPRLGRMLLEGHARGCASEVLVIVAALSIQDVRERPAEHQQSADDAHARFADPHSDFVTYLNLWRYLEVQARDLSGSAFRKLCQAEFLHYLRYREWRDQVSQLGRIARSLKLDVHSIDVPSPHDVREEARAGGVEGAGARAAVSFTASHRSVDVDDIHRSLLVGLLSNVGTWDAAKREYQGAHGTRFTIWPGSGLAHSHPDWVMTAELVETSRLFARTVARIDPRWVEDAAASLLKRTYSEPYWSRSHGAAMAKERVLLYGLTLAADRPVLLGRLGDLVIDSGAPVPFALSGFEVQELTARALAREMLIRHGLVAGNWRERHRFQSRNAQLLKEAREVEHRSRTFGIVADEDALCRFFDDRIPEGVISAAHFNRWWRREKVKNPELLTYTRQLLLPRGDRDDASNLDDFPEVWHAGGVTLPLSYTFSPGSERDGVTATIRLEQLPRVSDDGMDWLVPGLRVELLTQMIRALPKSQRRLLAPAPDVAQRCHDWMLKALQGRLSPEDARLAAGRSAQAGPSDTQDLQTPDPASLSAAMDRLARWGRSTGKARLQQSRSGATLSGAALGEERESAEVQAATAGDPPPPLLDWSVNRPSFFDAFVQAVRAVRGVDLSEDDVSFAREHLPAHVLMTFRVVDSTGRELGVGTDLAVLQRQLAQSADKAVVRAVRGAIAEALEDAQKAKEAEKQAVPTAAVDVKEALAKAAIEEAPPDATFHQDNLRAFPSISLPHSVTLRDKNAMTLRAFPTLVPQGSSADAAAGVRLLSNADEAAHQYRAGLAHLLLHTVRLPHKRVTTRWFGREALMLAASPYASIEALVDDVQLASALSLVDDFSGAGGPSSVRDPQSFEALVSAARDVHEDRVYEAIRHVVRALEAHAQLAAQIRRHSEASMRPVIRDVEDVVGALLYPGFVSATPWQVLPHVARYVRAGAMRIERASASAQALRRDTEDAARIEHLAERLDAAREDASHAPFDALTEARLVKARWLLEELRISCFAQSLGTAQKISFKRLSSLIDEVPR